MRAVLALFVAFLSLSSQIGQTDAAPVCGSMWSRRAAVAFPERSDHISVWWHDRLWVAGGGNYAANWTLYGDTWTTDANMTAWTLVSPLAAWSPRAYMASAVVNDVWVTTGGGHCEGEFKTPACPHYGWFGEVWATSDGAEWSLVSSSGQTTRSGTHNGQGSDGVDAVHGPRLGMRRYGGASTGPSVCTAPVLNRAGEVMFCPRGGHTLNAVPTAGGGATALVLAGGMNNSDLFNDVWRSLDGGASWTLIAAPAPWARRAFHASAAIGPTIYISGGATETASSDTIVNDVWFSADAGATWAEVTAAAAWSPRLAHTLTAIGRTGSFLLTAGQLAGTAVSDLATADAWTAKGNPLAGAWTLATANTTWPIRSYHVATYIPAPTVGADAQVAVTGGWRADLQAAPPGYRYQYYSDVWATAWEADCT